MTMITKAVAAEQQLNTSIRLFFESRDHLSSFALAVASRDLTDDMIESRYSELYQRELARLSNPQRIHLSERDTWKIRIKPEFYKDFLKLYRKSQNFLKHADRDTNTVIEPIKPRLLAVVIVMAIKNYLLIVQDWTVEMRFFFAWFAVAEPRLIKAEPKDEVFDKAVANIRGYIAGNPYDRYNLKNIHAALIKLPEVGALFVSRSLQDGWDIDSPL